MYLLKITITERPISEEKLAKHRKWFKENFDAGYFLIVGPFKDIESAGVIIAKANSRKQMEEIISQDGFYLHGAEYDLHEFKANLISEHIA